MCLMDKEALRLYAKLPVFKRRIEKAQEIITLGLKIIKKPYLSCSFGKDSIVLLHLVLQQSPDIPVVFINSNYCFPDTYQVRDAFVSDYKINLVEISQPYDYLEIIKQYGLPQERSKAQQNKVVNLLKKDLANEWAWNNGHNGNYWGLRKEEASGRRWLLNTKGSLFWAKNARLWRCSPLADWMWEDVWAYIHEQGIPYSGIYDKTGFVEDPRQIRNTSYITTDGANLNGRVAWLKYYYPELFDKVAKNIPELRRYV